MVRYINSIIYFIFIYLILFLNWINHLKLQPVACCCSCMLYYIFRPILIYLIFLQALCMFLFKTAEGEDRFKQHPCDRYVTKNKHLPHLICFYHCYTCMHFPELISHTHRDCDVTDGSHLLVLMISKWDNVSHCFCVLAQDWRRKKDVRVDDEVNRGLYNHLYTVI